MKITKFYIYKEVYGLRFIFSSLLNLNQFLETTQPQEMKNNLSFFTRHHEHCTNCI